MNYLKYLIEYGAIGRVDGFVPLSLVYGKFINLKIFGYFSINKYKLDYLKLSRVS